LLLNKLRRRSLLGRKKKTEGGFTLVELLVVVTILGILAVIVVAAVSGLSNNSQSAAQSTDNSVLATAEEAYCAQHGTYTDTATLQATGLLHNQSTLDDVQYTTPTDSTCGSYAVVAYPGPTTYPVTVTGCNGHQSTFTAQPTTIATMDGPSYEMLMWLSTATNPLGANSLAFGPMTTTDLPTQFQSTSYTTPQHFPAGASLTTAGAPYEGGPILAGAAYGTGGFGQLGYSGSYSDYNLPVADVTNPTLNGTATAAPGLVFGAFETAAPLENGLGNAGLNTYWGFERGQCSAQNAANSNTMTAQNVNRAVDGTIRDLKNLGIILNIQAQAAKVIGQIQSALASAITVAKPGAGVRIDFFDDVEYCGYRQGQSTCTPTSGTNTGYGANAVATGLLSQLSAANANGSATGDWLNRLSDGTLNTSYTLTDATNSGGPGNYAQNNPSILILAYDASPTADTAAGSPDATAAPSCGTQWNDASSSAYGLTTRFPAGTTIPAISNARYLCLSYEQFAYGGPRLALEAAPAIAKVMSNGS
jgi:prepilin-type N-terminal cleavage/methylation domain-containing protein